MSRCFLRQHFLFAKKKILQSFQSINNNTKLRCDYVKFINVLK